MTSCRRTAALRLLTVSVLAALPVACGSRTPLNYVPFSDDGTDDDPDASRERDASLSDVNADRSLDGLAGLDARRDGSDVRDATDAFDSADSADRSDRADIADVPDLPPCFAESREGKGIPIDFYFVVDKSNSMGADAGMQSRWSAMTNALNTFVRSPMSAGLGAGVNFFPKSSTGNNTLCAVNDYRVPDVPIGLLPDVAPRIATALAAQRLGPGTPTTPALEASLSYAKAEKIGRATRDVAVVIVTDGQPSQCGSSNSVNATVAVARTYANGSPPVRTYVLGIGPSVADLNALALAGGTAPAHLIESGGESELVTAFNAIRDNSITCDYLIPMRPGERLDFNLVNIQIRVGVNGAIMPLGKVDNAAACGAAGGWYYDQPVPPGNPAPTKITLCPATCDPLVQTAGSHLDMLVGCKTTSQSP
ncbi:MAG TPA: vWA domain-containing protein [Polyangiaceae bacterium]|nr:vWA domain-containing protein [Polyangiaceae bacterium]